jgi:hypothetical protein
MRIRVFLRATGLVPLAGWLPPHRNGTPAAAAGPAFPAAVRMVNRIHRDAPDSRPDAKMALAAGFAQPDILMVRIAHLTNRCLTID